jgi:hypothetical protein
VLADEDEFYKAKVSEKRMHPQKKITHRYMKILNEILPNVELNMYLGFKYDFIDGGIYQNDFIVSSAKFLKEAFGMVLNYKKMAYNLDDLNDMVSKLTHDQNFFKAIKNSKHLREIGNDFDHATRDYFDDCIIHKEVP